MKHGSEQDTQDKGTKSADTRAEMEALESRLARRDRDLAQLALVTSRDLRTPLRGINHLVDWIEEDLGGSATVELKEHLRLLRDRALRLDRTIHSLHQYARIGEIPANASTVNVGVMVDALARKIAPDRRNELDIGELPTLMAARGLLQRVFQGLLESAFEHRREGDGPIVVRAREVDGKWEFCVVSGVLDEQRAAQLFERMHGDTIRSEDAIDLGLMVIRRIVEDEGGKTWVRAGDREIPSMCFTWPKITEG